MDHSDLMSPAEVAARLRMSRATLYVLLRTNPEFPAPLRVSPRRPRWRAAEIDAWVETRRDPACAA